MSYAQVATSRRARIVPKTPPAQVEAPHEIGLETWDSVQNQLETHQKQTKNNQQE